MFSLEAACGCRIGKIRKNNEDNFLFNGRCLDAENNGLDGVLEMKQTAEPGTWLAVFDGMGGENYGEDASYAAASALQKRRRQLAELLLPGERYLNKLALELNRAVLDRAEELRTDFMGTTMAALYFAGSHLFACNLGDSRIYRFHESALTQVSLDHSEHQQGRRKPPLTQHLGISPEVLQLEPCVKKFPLKREDRYLVCSDGLTDMLSDGEIEEILRETPESGRCVEKLLDAVYEKGAKDNATIIVCRIL